MAKIVLRSAKPKGGARFQPATTRGMRSVAVRARSFDPTSRKFEFVLASETPCRTYRLDRNWNIVEVDEILPMAALRGLEDFRGCPLLDTHSSWSVRDVLGRITSLRTEGTQLIGNAFLSDREDVAGIARDIETGILAEFSVGFDIEDEGTIEEREGDIPLVRVGAWRVREGSLVPLPADSTAVMRGAGSARTISRLRASTSRAGARNNPTKNGARAMTPEELEALLDSTFRSATTAIVAALTDATADDGDDTGADDLEAEAEAAAEAARASILAKGRSKSGKTAPKAPAGGARTTTPAQEAAQKLHARNIAKRNGKVADFDDLDKAGGTIEELRDLAKRSVSTTPGEIGNAPAPAGKRGLIRLEDTAAGKRKGAAK